MASNPSRDPSAGPSGSSSQPAPSNSPSRPTAFAVKYGLAERENWPDLYKSGRSELTPGGFLPIRPRFMSEYDWELHERRAVSQRLYYLESFTTWEMEDVGAAAYPGSNSDSKLPTLQDPLHPLLQRKAWQTPAQFWPLYRSDNFKIGGGSPGMWDPWRNDEVWALLEPILRIVSSFLNNIHHWPWVDGLVYGKRTQIPLEEIDDGLPPECLRAFHCRSPEVSGSDASKEALAGFLTAMTRDTFFIMGTRDEDITGQESDSYAWSDKLLANRPDGTPNDGFVVALSWQLLHPLLKLKLSNEEILCQRFFVAITLLHEIIHCIHYHYLDNSPEDEQCDPAVYSEPFFESEEVAELGWSFEKAVMGDRLHNLPSSISSSLAPSIGLYTDTTWNFHTTYTSAVDPQMRKRKSDRFGVGAELDYWLVSAKAYENIQQHDFWTTNVAQFRDVTWKAQKAWIFGHRFINTGNDGFNHLNYDLITGPGYDDYVEKHGKKKVRAVTKAGNFENRRVTAVKAALAGNERKFQSSPRASPERLTPPPTASKPLIRQPPSGGAGDSEARPPGLGGASILSPPPTAKKPESGVRIIDLSLLNAAAIATTESLPAPASGNTLPPQILGKRPRSDSEGSLPGVSGLNSSDADFDLDYIEVLDGNGNPIDYDDADPDFDLDDVEVLDGNGNLINYESADPDFDPDDVEELDGNEEVVCR